MRQLRVWNDRIADNQLNVIDAALKRGEIIIYPTDTLYAIGCNAFNSKSVEEICRLKQIDPRKCDLSIICSDISMAAKYTRIDNEAFKLLKKYTPGPFTFILPVGNGLPRQFKYRKTVGVRIPDCSVVREIAERLSNPLMTTSVACAKDKCVEDFLRQPTLIASQYKSVISLIIDAGEGGIEQSTIIDLTGDEPILQRNGKGIFEGK